MDLFFSSYRAYPIAFVAELITLLPIVIGLFRLSYNKKQVGLLILFFLCVFIRDIISNIFANYGNNNLFIYNLFSFCELVFLAFFFVNNPRIHSRKYRQVIIWGGGVALLLNSFFYSKNDFSVENFSIVRIYGLFLILLFFERVLSELTIKNIIIYSMFWVSTGLLLYFCGTFFIFLLSDKVLSKDAKPEVFQQYWDTNLVFYILFCVLASIGIWFSKFDQENLI